MEKNQEKSDLYKTSLDPLEAPLNFAHQQHRRSECHLRAGRLKEATADHQKAVDYLEEALTKAQSDRGKQSIELQLAFHRRQQEIIDVKMQRLEEWRNNNNSNEDDSDIVNPLPVSRHELHSTILKMLDEHDSLLQVLHGNRNNNMSKSDSTVTEMLSNDNNNAQIKKPKDSEMVIEELKFTNHELRKLVEQLIAELAAERAKNKELRITLDEQSKKIYELKTSRTPLSQFASPFGFSPLCELSPGGTIRDLPNLPPLEFPKFDYDMLLKATVSPNGK